MCLTRLSTFFVFFGFSVKIGYMAYQFPKKIFPSTINHYLKCPFKFKCHNDPEVKAEYVETPENFTGSVAHDVLDNFFNIKKTPMDKRKEQDIALMIREVWGKTPKEKRTNIFGSTEQERAYGLQTITMLKNYLATADLTAVPLSLEDWMESKLGDFVIAGRVDRIDQDSDSSIAVWDYKTGKLPFHGTIDKIIEEDLQVPIYAIIASKLNPFAEQIKVGLIYIKYSKIYDKVWKKEEIKDLEERVEKVVKKAKADKKLEPKVNKLCPWCEYKGICPAYAEGSGEAKPE